MSGLAVGFSLISVDWALGLGVQGMGCRVQGQRFRMGSADSVFSPSSPLSCDLPVLTPYMSFGVETLCSSIQRNVKSN